MDLEGERARQDVKTTAPSFLSLIKNHTNMIYMLN